MAGIGKLVKDGAKVIKKATKKISDKHQINQVKRQLKSIQRAPGINNKKGANIRETFYANPNMIEISVPNKLIKRVKNVGKASLGAAGAVGTLYNAKRKLNKVKKTNKK